MPKVTRLLLRTGASAASLGAFALNKAAETLQGLAAESPDPPSRADVPVEHRNEASRPVPVVAPDEKPSNPAAPAGADPDGTSGTGPVPRRISNPKAARKARKRAESGTAVAESINRLEAKGSAKGAKPGTAAKAEPTPAELAKSGKGRQPAPMGSSSG